MQTEDKSRQLEDLFKNQIWPELIDALKATYIAEDYKLGAKQWQEFYDIDYKVGYDAGRDDAEYPAGKSYHTS
jgi:hypothetical protein